MEETQQPGINIVFIRLLKANVEIRDPQADKRYDLRLTGLKRGQSEDHKNLDIVAAFDVMHGVENPLFNFTCQFVVRYERHSDDSMPWDQFSTATALAHIIPYLREFVSNMTNRLPAPLLMIDAINTHALIADFEQRTKASGEETEELPDEGDKA